jgi:hypothetical protein
MAGNSTSRRPGRSGRLHDGTHEPTLGAGPGDEKFLYTIYSTVYKTRYNVIFPCEANLSCVGAMERTSERTERGPIWSERANARSGDITSVQCLSVQRRESLVV